MGLFSRKVKFDEGPPLEPALPSIVVDQAPDPPAPSPPPIPAAMAPPTPSAPVPVPVAPAPSQPRVPYSIEDAVRLMRSLPVEQNTDLVVRVVRQTLESMNVRIEDIVGEAERKEALTQDRINTVRKTIAELETNIRTCREEIRRLETELSETVMVKQRLRPNTPPLPGKNAG